MVVVEGEGTERSEGWVTVLVEVKSEKETHRGRVRRSEATDYPTNCVEFERYGREFCIARGNRAYKQQFWEKY